MGYQYKFTQFALQMEPKGDDDGLDGFGNDAPSEAPPARDSEFTHCLVLATSGASLSCGCKKQGRGVWVGSRHAL